jgi:hypothetical protein
MYNDDLKTFYVDFHELPWFYGTLKIYAENKADAKVEVKRNVNDFRITRTFMIMILHNQCLTAWLRKAGNPVFRLQICIDMTYDDYYRQLKLQIDIIKEVLDKPQVDNFVWRYSVHKEVCKLDHIIGEYYNDDYDGLMGR